MILETRSTPFSTPARITQNTRTANTINHASTWKESEINSVKYPSCATVCTFPFKYSTRYLITHPPIEL